MSTERAQTGNETDTKGDILLAEIEKNASERVRIQKREYRGKVLVDIRVFYEDQEGEYKPTAKGVCLSVDRFPELLNALQEAAGKLELPEFSEC